MTHVCNVYAHLPKALVELADGERIVEVFGILRVDGASENLAKVFALGQVLLGDVARNFLCGLFNGFWISVRQAILGQNGVHLHIVIACRSQHIYHLAKQVLVVGIGPLGNFHHGFVARLAAFESAFRDDDVVHIEAFGRHEEGHVAFHPQPSYHLILSALKDLDDLCLLHVSLSAGQKLHPHAVAVECPGRITFTHEDGRRAIVGQERVFAVGFPHETPLEHLAHLVETIGTVADLGQEIVPGHLFHHIDGQHFERMRIELELLKNLFKAECLSRLRAEEVVQAFCHLSLRHPLAAFFTFCHNVFSC